MIRLYTPTQNTLEGVLFKYTITNANIKRIYSVEDHTSFSNNDSGLHASTVQCKWSQGRVRFLLYNALACGVSNLCLPVLPDGLILLPRDL